MCSGIESGIYKLNVTGVFEHNRKAPIYAKLYHDLQGDM